MAVAAAAAKSLPSCLTLCDPIDGNPPGSPVPEILQTRTLEWVAISFSNACGSCAATQQLKNPTNCSFLTSDRARIAVALGSLETLDSNQEKEMATHSSVLAWRSPGTGEPGGLPSVGSHREIGRAHV